MSVIFTPIKFLPPGLYTVHGKSANGVGTGVVLVEVYVVEGGSASKVAEEAMLCRCAFEEAVSGVAEVHAKKERTVAGAFFVDGWRWLKEALLQRARGVARESFEVSPAILMGQAVESGFQESEAAIAAGGWIRHHVIGR